MKSKSIVAVSLGLALLLMGGAALAHGVRMYAYGEEGRIKGEAYFAGGSKIKGAKVLLLDQKGNQLAEAKTSAEGGFALPMPQVKPPYRLVVKAGQGHQGEYWLNAKDLGLAAKKVKAMAAPAKPDRPMAAPAAGQLEAALERALDKKLAPIKARLDILARDKEPTWQDILGGLGWIIGLFGVAAYFMGRRKGAK